MAALLTACGAFAAATTAASSSAPEALTAAAAAPGSPPAAAAQGLPFSFRAYPYEVRDLAMGARPFSSSGVVPREDPGIHDRQGVRMRRIDGRLYDFPRGQATYGLLNLRSFLVTHDQFFLDRAFAQAQRLRDTRVVAGDAWFYPNAPSKHRHGRPGEFIAAPYYSALAQGRALMFLSRLAEVTQQPVWQEAADHTFASFVRRESDPGPCVANVDSQGYYWLQEWPWPNLPPDCTFNGHNSAAFGLYEYWHLTRDAQAHALFRGAATTAQHYAGAFRQPGWVSLYCLAHRAISDYYHSYHVGQLLELYRMTGAVAFARFADGFSGDYPRPAVSGALCIEPGQYVALRFGRDGRISDRLTVVVRRTVTVPATRRQRQLRGGDVYLRVAAAPCPGYWLAERPGRVFVRGAVVVRKYDPGRTLQLAAGRTYAAIKLDRSGVVVDRAEVQAEAQLELAADAGAVVSGHPSVRLAGGELGGYWLALAKGVRLR